MPLAFIFIGILLIVSGIKNTLTGPNGLGATLANDLTGAGSFWYWIVGLGSVGALGYNDDLKPISRAMLMLILVVFVVSNNGVWKKFQDAFAAPSASNANPAPSTPAPSTGNGFLPIPNSPSGNNTFDLFNIPGLLSPGG